MIIMCYFPIYYQYYILYPIYSVCYCDESDAKGMLNAAVLLKFGVYLGTLFCLSVTLYRQRLTEALSKICSYRCIRQWRLMQCWMLILESEYVISKASVTHINRGMCGNENMHPNINNVQHRTIIVLLETFKLLIFTYIHDLIV